MKVYSIFDDYSSEAVEIIKEACIDLTVHPKGVQRPDHDLMKKILEQYDCIIIGTSQKITEDMFENVDSPKVIATASVGIDHIHIPCSKVDLIKIINTPKANAQSVAEYTIGCALNCCKRIIEGRRLYQKGINNKSLSKKPEDLSGRLMGVVGAGNISKRIIEYARFFGMDIICWTPHPDNHKDLLNLNVSFVDLDELLKNADVISVNLPNKRETINIISSDRIALMKNDAVFISVSRIATMDYRSLINKADKNPNFYICLDIDVDEDVVSAASDLSNVIITPHIAGGTIETRKRMFIELAEHIIKL